MPSSARDRKSLFGKFSRPKGPSLSDEDMYARIDSEPLPSARGAGADGHLLMRWPIWCEQIWRMNGDKLLAREHDVADWVVQTGCHDFRAAAPELFTDMPNLHALFSDQKPVATVAYPRNASVFAVSTSGRFNVLIGDYNRYLRAHDNGVPVPRLYPATVAAASYPDRHPMVVSPGLNTEIPMWAQVAGNRILTNVPNLHDKFDVYSREPAFVEAVLTDDIVDRLRALGSARVFADHGRVVLVSTKGWVDTSEMSDFAYTAALLSRAGWRAVQA